MHEQILLIESEGYTVVRGKIRDDGSIEVAPTTCFPAVPGVDCADDYIVQLATSTSLAPYTKDVGGAVRSYVTTPPACPADGFWRYSVQFFWGDGSVDDVVSRQPCVQG